MSDQNPKDGEASNMKITEQQLKMTEKVKKLEVRYVILVFRILFGLFCFKVLRRKYKNSFD